MIESLIYSNVQHEEVMSASQIAPWIVPAMRSKIVYNTEHLKGKKRNESSIAQGCPKRLASAIRTGDYDPLQLQTYSLTKLTEISKFVNLINMSHSTKVIHKILYVFSLLLASNSKGFGTTSFTVVGRCK